MATDSKQPQPEAKPSPVDDASSKQETATKPAAPKQPSEAEQISKLEDALLRARAENQNIAKRLRAEISRAELRGTENVLAGMLAVADNLEQALDHADADKAALRDGVALTLSAFNSVLSSNGMEIINPKPGEKLDPHLHLAISSEAHTEHPVNSIVRVVLKGYRHQQRILRPANVVVSLGTTETSSPDNGESPNK